MNETPRTNAIWQTYCEEDHSEDFLHSKLEELEHELTRAYAHHKECHDASVDRENTLRAELAEARSKQFDPAIHITDVHADNIALRDVLEKFVEALENHVKHPNYYPISTDAINALAAARAELDRVA